MGSLDHSPGPGPQGLASVRASSCGHHVEPVTWEKPCEPAAERAAQQKPWLLREATSCDGGLLFSSLGSGEYGGLGETPGLSIPGTGAAGVHLSTGFTRSLFCGRLLEAVAMVTEQEVEAIGKTLVDPKEPLQARFRALFTLRGLGGPHAIAWISRAFEDSSALLKHELAYCLGQMQDSRAIPVLVDVLRDTSQEPMVRHEAGE